MLWPAPILDGEPAGDFAQPAIGSSRTDIRVICLPASDQADEMAAAILSQVAERERYAVFSLPVADSASDVVRDVAPRFRLSGVTSSASRLCRRLLS